MSNKKWLYTAFNILLYAAGFPVLFIISLVKSIEWNSYGMYGASSFAPLIAVIILWVLVGGIQALVYNLLRKKGKDCAKKLMIKVMIIPIAVIIGLMGILDIAMPPLLKDATSNTILYEDVVYDWQGMHEKLIDRVELFKEKNGMADSVRYQDKEFQDVFQKLFKSMDQAYKAFDPLAIEIALDQPDMFAAIQNGNFPIMLAATLLLKTADGNANNHNLEGLGDLLTQNLDTIGKIVEQIDTLDINDPASINNLLNTALVTKEFDGIRWNIFNIIGSNMLFPEIDPNADIHEYNSTGHIDKGSVGACLGYQDMSWLNGIPQMFFIPLMSMRTLFYIFAALIAVFTVMQFYVAGAYAKKNDKEFSLYMLGKN